MSMKICFSGPSGSGKSTLARFVSNELGIPYIENSGYSKLLSADDRDYLFETFGYYGKGHKEVIRQSNINPEFGKEFQRMVLLARNTAIMENPEFVADRSPIDNVVYMLTQTSMFVNNAWVDQFFGDAYIGYQNLTHLVFITCSNPEIEENRSRVTNLFYQKMISSIFDHVFREYFQHVKGPKVLWVDFWDLERRKKEVMEFLNPSQTELPL
jgi:hypothetical protein